MRHLGRDARPECFGLLLLVCVLALRPFGVFCGLLGRFALGLLGLISIKLVIKGLVDLVHFIPPSLGYCVLPTGARNRIPLSRAFPPRRSASPGVLPNRSGMSTARAGAPGLRPRVSD